MDFWNIAIPVLIFLVPALACLYLPFGGRLRSVNKSKWGLITFGVAILVSILGAAHFEQPVRMESLWPISADPSGYFEFNFQLHWTRYIWIIFSNVLLFGLMLLDGRGLLKDEAPGVRYALLPAASLFLSLAYLSENVFLSLIFIEITIFLLYAFNLHTSEPEGEAERVSYFKRSCFIFLAVIAMLALAATGEFSTSSVMLLGVVLYIASFVFSKHNFSGWRQLPIALLQSGTVFFLLGRAIREDMSPELWLPLSGVFGIAAAFFSGLSVLSLSSLGSSFWMIFSFMGYVLFLRFSSGKPEDQFWGTFEAVALLLVFSLSCLLRFARLADQGWKKAVYFVLAGLSLAIVSGAIPGVDIASPKTTGESSVKLVVFAVLTFLLSFTVGRSLATAFAAKKKDEGAADNFLLGVAASLTVLLIQIGAVLRMSDIYGESPFRMGLAYLLTSPHVVTAGSALMIGLMGGFLLGANSRFLGWINGKEQRMEDFFPGIDPLVISWNEKIAQLPGRGMSWTAKKLGVAAIRSAAFVESGDRLVFGEKFYEGFRKYGSSVSALVRYFHSGSVRAYMFTGVLITLVASLLFLLGVR